MNRDDPHPRDYALLLGMLLAAFFIQGAAGTGRFQQVVVTLLLAGTMLLSLHAAGARPSMMRAGMLIALAVCTASVIEAARGDVDGTAVRLANLVLVVIAPPAVVLGVVRRLRARNKVTIEAVFGALCFYLLLGMMFSFVYGAMDRIGSAGFFAGGQAASAAHCIYFSFTTLATIGYGDFTAKGDLGHILSVLEGLVGQLYLVTVVAVIVSNLGRGREAPQ